MKNPGVIVSWESDGVRKRGIAYNKNQIPSLVKQGKVLVNVTDEKFKPTGEEIIKLTDYLTVRGFVD